MKKTYTLEEVNDIKQKHTALVLEEHRLATLEERQRILKIVEGMRIIKCFFCGKLEVEHTDGTHFQLSKENIGFNQALNEVISSIEKK
jgi:hypothetical protein